MSLTYADALAFLCPRTTGGTKWSLGPTRALLATLGHPERHFPAIHVGGTNGKGSVCALVYAALRASGRRVGLYTSPHLVDVRERMVVNDRPISPEAFASWTERLRPLIETWNGSFFEATTAIAFADFAARGIDIAVIEVGLGGRLDSTNVLEPLVSAVTSIGLDHTDYLGPTLGDVACEKAGIAKPGTPFVIGEEDAGVSADLERHAHAAGARVFRVPSGAAYQGPLALRGPHQRRNAAIAETILAELPAAWRPPGDAVAAGFASARLAGRFDRRSKWIFDVAHNPGGADVLVQALNAEGAPRPLHALVGILRDKDWRSMLTILSPVVDRLWLTEPPTAPADRRWNLDEVQDWLDREAGSEQRGARGGKGETNEPSRRGRSHFPLPASRFPPVVVEPEFENALRDVQQGAGTILVTGSFHTVGDALGRLPGFAPLG